VFVLLSILHCAACNGWSKTAIFFVFTSVISYVLEEIGVRTGWIYGRYHYGDMLGPELGNAIATSIDENLPRKETAISTHGPHSRLSGVATVSFTTNRNIFVKVLTPSIDFRSAFGDANRKARQRHGHNSVFGSAEWQPGAVHVAT
jgi:hypothetical protein